MTAPRGDALIQRICNGATADEANQLIAEFASGYPVAQLRQLFQSDSEQAVKAGAWIASELGPRVAPLLADISRLLHHRAPYVRAFALDAVLLAASTVHGEVIATAVSLIDDEDEAVRWKSMHFLARATRQQLQAGLRHVTDVRLAALLKWLLDVSSGPPVDTIIARLDDDGAKARRLFAAAAAARVGDTTLVPLRHASESSDKELSSFAREWLEARGERP